MRGSELYGGSGFREKTLRWEIATGRCRSREIGDTLGKAGAEQSECTLEAGRQQVVNAIEANDQLISVTISEE
jgi:uncharacterized protein with GYD domain